MSAAWFATILIGRLILGAVLKTPSVILIRERECAMLKHDLDLINDATTQYATRR